jgi:hypothetical protein
VEEWKRKKKENVKEIEIHTIQDPKINTMIIIINQLPLLLLPSKIGIQEPGKQTERRAEIPEIQEIPEILEIREIFRLQMQDGIHHVIDMNI